MIWVDIFLAAIILFTITSCTWACRMSYEKYCLRVNKPFKTWLRER
jgi:hypothetical protein